MSHTRNFLRFAGGTAFAALLAWLAKWTADEVADERLYVAKNQHPSREPDHVVIQVVFVRVARDFPDEEWSRMNGTERDWNLERIDDTMSFTAQDIRSLFPENLFLVRYSSNERAIRSGTILERELDSEPHSPAEWLEMDQPQNDATFSKAVALDQISILHEARPDAVLVLVTHESVIREMAGIKKSMIRNGHIMPTTLKVPCRLSAHA